MRSSTAARRYARAIAESASTGESFDQWLESLRVVEEALKDTELENLLSNPNVSPAAKYSLIERLLPKMSKAEANLMRLLIRHRRLELVGPIREELQRIVDERKGLVKAHVVSAIPLDSERTAQVVRRLSEMTGKQVVVETSVDPSILGGLVIRLGDRVIDGSLASRLQSLRQRLH